MITINGEFSNSLVKHTIAKSHFETSRDYLSLSSAIKSVEEIVSNYRNGYEADTKALLKCYKGYQMEEDMLRRIVDVFGKDIKLAPSIIAYEGLVKGHPDFLYSGYPSDCKSVLKDDWLPKSSRDIPSRIYWQMQAYMLYSQQDKALVVFESRESGLIRDYWLTQNARIQNQIDFKYSEAVKIIG